jgi:NADH:ubiquinone oxidoreductase subunit 3 (subunit A)
LRIVNLKFVVFDSKVVLIYGVNLQFASQPMTLELLCVR